MKNAMVETMKGIVDNLQSNVNSNAARLLGNKPVVIPADLISTLSSIRRENARIYSVQELRNILKSNELANMFNLPNVAGAKLYIESGKLNIVAVASSGGTNYESLILPTGVQFTKPIQTTATQLHLNTSQSLTSQLLNHNQLSGNNMQTQIQHFKDVYVEQAAQRIITSLNGRSSMSANEMQTVSHQIVQDLIKDLTGTGNVQTVEISTEHVTQVMVSSFTPDS